MRGLNFRSSKFLLRLRKHLLYSISSRIRHKALQVRAFTILNLLLGVKVREGRKEPIWCRGES